MRILDRYIFREFLSPFMFCVLGFTVILLSGLLFELTDLIFVKNVPVFTVSRMLLYKVPGMMVLTLPIAALFSTLLSLGRLAQDNEITVMRISGISFFRIMTPVIIAGLCVSGLTFLANEQIVPWSNRKFENTLRGIIFAEGLPAVQENVFFRGADERYFYIQNVFPKSNKIENIMVYDLSASGFPTLITAESGTYQDNHWFLHNGFLQEMDEEGFVNYQTKFEDMQLITEDKGEVLFSNQKTTEEMNRQELRSHIERFQRGGLQVRSFVVDYHMKLSLPMSSLIFAIFGAPLSLKTKGGRSFGIAVSLIVTIVYYIMTSVSRSLGVNGVLPPVMAAWFTNILFVLIGFLLIRYSD